MMEFHQSKLYVEHSDHPIDLIHSNYLLAASAHVAWAPYK